VASEGNMMRLSLFAARYGSLFRRRWYMQKVPIDLKRRRRARQYRLLRFERKRRREVSNGRPMLLPGSGNLLIRTWN